MENTKMTSRARSIAVGPSKIQSPMLLLYARSGLPPYCTADVVAKHWLSNPVVVAACDLVVAPGVDGFKRFGKGIHSYLGLPRDVTVIVTPRDVWSGCEGDTVAGNDFATLDTTMGRKKVMVTEYAELIRHARPDMYVPLYDEPIPLASKNRTRKGVERSLKLLEGCMSSTSSAVASATNTHEQFDGSASANDARGPQVVGAIQGGVITDARKHSTTLTAEHDVEGFFVCGVGRGESDAQRENAVIATMGIIEQGPKHALPRMIAGCDTPRGMMWAVDRGFDMLLSCYPFSATEMGRALVFPIHPVPQRVDDEDVAMDGSASKEVAAHGGAMHLNLHDTAFARDSGVIDRACTCPCCSAGHTRAYIHHLLVAHEMLASILLMWHNVHHVNGFIAAMRQALEDNRFVAYRDAMTPRLL